MKIVLTGLLFIVSMGMSGVLAQTIAVTEKGDSIHVFSDGTWKPIESSIGLSIPVFGSVGASKDYNAKTKQVTITTDNWNYFGIDKQEKAISGSIKKIENDYHITLLYYGDLGCLKKGESSIKIQLSNGFIIEGVQTSRSDCSSPLKASFIPVSKSQYELSDYTELMNKNIQLLATYDWQRIRIEGSVLHADFSPYPTKKLRSPEQFFRQHLSALSR